MCDSKELNNQFESFVQASQSLIDKYAPVKKASRKKRNYY